MANDFKIYGDILSIGVRLWLISKQIGMSGCLTFMCKSIRTKMKLKRDRTRFFFVVGSFEATHRRHRDAWRERERGRNEWLVWFVIHRKNHGKQKTSFEFKCFFFWYVQIFTTFIKRRRYSRIRGKSKSGNFVCQNVPRRTMTTKWYESNRKKKACSFKSEWEKVETGRRRKRDEPPGFQDRTAVWCVHETWEMWNWHL